MPISKSRNLLPVQDNSTLVQTILAIRSASKADGGSYTCVFTNRIGSGSKVILLKVLNNPHDSTNSLDDDHHHLSKPMALNTVVVIASVVVALLLLGGITGFYFLSKVGDCFLLNDLYYFL